MNTQNERLRFPAWRMAAFFVVVACFFLRALFAPGAVIFSDLDFGFRTQGYMDRISGIWNDNWSTTTLFNSSRLYVTAPFFVFSFLFSHYEGLFQKMLFIGAFAGAGFTLSYAVSTLLGILGRAWTLRITETQVLLVSIYAGLLYAFNPWVLMRVQHFYLLVGYVMVPLICAGMFLLVEHITSQRSVPRAASDGSTGARPRLWRMLSAQHLYVTPHVIGLLLGIACAWAVAAASIHYFFWIFFLFSAWVLWSMVYVSLARHVAALYRLAGMYILVGLVLFVFVGFWLLPQVGFNALGNISPTNVNTLDSLSLLSRNITVQNVFYGVSYWWGFFEVATLPRSFWIAGASILGCGLLFSLRRLWDYRISFLWVGYVITFLFALGPKGPLQGLYVNMLFEWPLASKIGFLLRDPDKFVGLLFFFAAMLVGVGAGFFTAYVNALRELAEREQFASFARWQMIGATVLVGWMWVALFFYVRPLHTLYAEHFLVPVEQPAEYAAMRQIMQQTLSTGERWMSVPRYEELISPGEGFAVTTWNDVDPPRSTSSIDLWSLPFKTYHPLESAYYRVKHFYSFVHHLLADGMSERLRDVVDDTGIRMMLHHSDVKTHARDDTRRGWAHQGSAADHEDYAEGTRDDVREDMVKRGFFEAITLPQSSRIGETVSSFLWSGHNFNTLDTYAFDPDIDTRATVPIFYEQFTTDHKDHFFTADDILDESSIRNFALSTLPSKFHHAPHTGLDRGDPFVGWAATNTAQLDWRWHTRQTALSNAAYELDPGHGLIFTRAASQLTTSPFDDVPEGNVIIDMSQVVADENFFVLYAPEEVEVRKEPVSHYDHLPSYKMSLAASPEESAHLVSTKKIPAIGRHIYRFDMTMSSVDTRFLHAKVIYYDKYDRQAGVAYAGSPEHTGTFDALRFYGLFVTPADTVSMEIQLWSTQRTERKTYWWVHDFRLSDLHEYADENTVSIPFDVAQSGEHYVFFKALYGWAGGRITFSLDEAQQTGVIHTKPTEDVFKDISVLTQSQLNYTREGLQGTNEFVWFPGGVHPLESGTHELSITNFDGFNAVSDVVIVPRQAFELHVRRAQERAMRMQQRISLEGEHDFHVEGANVQFTESRADLSQGQALYVNEGTLTQDIEIFEDNLYAIKLYVGDSATISHPRVNLQVTHDSGEIIELWPDIIARRDEGGVIPLPEIYLEQGSYTLTITVRDDTPTAATLESIHKIEYNEVIDLDPLITYLPESRCCYCEKLSDEDIGLVVDQSELLFTLTAGHSCDWGIIATDKIAVTDAQEWLITYDERARDAKSGHAKIVFLDQDDVVLDVEYVRQKGTVSTYDWRHQQALVSVPDGTTKMQVQWWMRQNPSAIGEIGVRDLIIKNYHSLPHIDLVTITESVESDREYQGGMPLHGSFAGTKRALTYEEGGAAVRGIKMYETYQPLWSMRRSGVQAAAVPMYGFLGGYIFPSAGDAIGTQTLIYSLGGNRILYLIGIGMLGFFVALGLWRFLHTRFVRVNHITHNK